jgi:hypothetical protein
MAAALTCDRQRGGQSDVGWQQLRLQSEREWLLARIAEKPDLTLRAVWPELAERGTAASYGAVWRFFNQAGITFKKNFARQRTGPRRRRSPADPVEGASGRIDPKRLVFIDETPAFAGAGSFCRRCATTASPRPASSTGRSTAAAFAPMSSSSWLPP